MEVDVSAQQPMGAYDDIDFTRGELGDAFFVFFCAAETADHVDDDRILCHAFAKGVEVLLAKYGGRHEDGDLLARKHSLKRGADGDFCFSEADITTD